jgi:hypothetical protein
MSLLTHTHIPCACAAALVVMGVVARRVAALSEALAAQHASGGARVEMITRTQWETRMLARHPQLANGGRLAMLLMDRDFDANDYQVSACAACLPQRLRSHQPAALARPGAGAPR